MQEECGWGTNIQDPIRPGMARYEYGVYEKEKLIEIFGTDVADSRWIVEDQARGHVDYLQKQNPRNQYEVRQLSPPLQDDGRSEINPVPPVRPSGW